MTNVAILLEGGQTDFPTTEWKTEFRQLLEWSGNHLTYASDLGLATKTLNRTSEDCRDLFSEYAEFIESHRTSQSTRLVVVVDHADLAKLNPLKECSWEGLVAMLMLAFPDVRWSIVFPTGCPDPEIDIKRYKVWMQVKSCCGVEKIVAGSSNPLFDDCGLRLLIRLNMQSDGNVRGENEIYKRERFDCKHLPTRNSICIVLDEEQDFREYHALIAFGRGLRVNAVESWKEAKLLLGQEGVFGNKNLEDDDSQPSICSKYYKCDLALTIEDIFLNFRDQPNDLHLSNLDNRKGELPALCNFSRRRFVTVGHDRSNANRIRKTQLERIRVAEVFSTSSCFEPKNQQVFKPANGIYGLWRQLKLGEFFVRKDNTTKTDEAGHSTPGRLLQIAEFLIWRAKEKREDVNTVPEAVECAVFAIHAQELLGGKTPTASLDALMLRHEFELRAECEFAGVQNSLEVSQRMEAVNDDVRHLALYFGANKKQRKITAVNGEIAILGRLVEILREFDQLEEEQRVMVRLRKLHRKIKFAKLPGLIKPFEVFPAYVEKLLSSFAVFLAAIVFWIFAFGLVHHLVFGINFGEGIAASFMTFLGTGSSGGESIWKPGDGFSLGFVLVSSTVLMGFVHLGIFISHLYSLVNRK